MDPELHRRVLDLIKFKGGGYDHYPDMHPISWSWDHVGRGIFYHDRKLNPAFLSVVT